MSDSLSVSRASSTASSRTGVAGPITPRHQRNRSHKLEMPASANSLPSPTSSLALKKAHSKLGISDHANDVHADSMRVKPTGSISGKKLGLGKGTAALKKIVRMEATLKALQGKRPSVVMQAPPVRQLKSVSQYTDSEDEEFSSKATTRPPTSIELKQSNIEPAIAVSIPVELPTDVQSHPLAQLNKDSPQTLTSQRSTQNLKAEIDARTRAHAKATASFKELFRSPKNPAKWLASQEGEEEKMRMSVEAAKTARDASPAKLSSATSTTKQQISPMQPATARSASTKSLTSPRSTKTLFILQLDLSGPKFAPSPTAAPVHPLPSPSMFSSASARSLVEDQPTKLYSLEQLESIVCAEPAVLQVLTHSTSQMIEQEMKQQTIPFNSSRLSLQPSTSQSTLQPTSSRAELSTFDSSPPPSFVDPILPSSTQSQDAETQEEANYLEFASDDFIQDETNSTMELSHRISASNSSAKLSSNLQFPLRIQSVISPSHSTTSLTTGGSANPSLKSLHSFIPPYSKTLRYNGSPWVEELFTPAEFKDYLALGLIQYLKSCKSHGIHPLAPIMNSILSSGLHTPASISLPHYGLNEVQGTCLSALLQHNTTVTLLDLTDNNLGFAGIEAIAKSLLLGRSSQSSSRDDFTQLDQFHAAPHQLASDESSHQGNTSLLTLILTSNNFEFGAASASTTNLLTSRTTNENVSVPPLSILGRMLAANTTLITLQLSFCHISDRHLFDFIPALSNDRRLSGRPSGLTTLKLDNNSISDRGAKCISTMLTHNSTLTHVDLSHNCIRDEGGTHLAQAIAAHPSLRLLNLGHNGLGSRAGLAFANAISHADFRLQSLNLEHNQIAGVKTWKKLMESIVTNQKLKNIKPIEEKKEEEESGDEDDASSTNASTYYGLQHINLSGNRLAAADASIIANAQKELQLYMSTMFNSLPTRMEVAGKELDQDLTYLAHSRHRSRSGDDADTVDDNPRHQTTAYTIVKGGKHMSIKARLKKMDRVQKQQLKQQSSSRNSKKMEPSKKIHPSLSTKVMSIKMAVDTDAVPLEPNNVSQIVNQTASSTHESGLNSERLAKVETNEIIKVEPSPSRSLESNPQSKRESIFSKKPGATQAVGDSEIDQNPSVQALQFPSIKSSHPDPASSIFDFQLSTNKYHSFSSTPRSMVTGGTDVTTTAPVEAASSFMPIQIQFDNLPQLLSREADDKRMNQLLKVQRKQALVEKLKEEKESRIEQQKMDEAEKEERKLMKMLMGGFGQKPSQDNTEKKKKDSKKKVVKDTNQKTITDKKPSSSVPVASPKPPPAPQPQRDSASSGPFVPPLRVKASSSTVVQDPITGKTERVLRKRPLVTQPRTESQTHRSSDSRHHRRHPSSRTTHSQFVSGLVPSTPSGLVALSGSGRASVAMSPMSVESLDSYAPTPETERSSSEDEAEGDGAHVDETQFRRHHHHKSIFLPIHPSNSGVPSQSHTPELSEEDGNDLIRRVIAGDQDKRKSNRKSLPMKPISNKANLSNPKTPPMHAFKKEVKEAVEEDLKYAATVRLPGQATKVKGQPREQVGPTISVTQVNQETMIEKSNQSKSKKIKTSPIKAIDSVSLPLAVQAVSEPGTLTTAPQTNPLTFHDEQPGSTKPITTNLNATASSATKSKKSKSDRAPPASSQPRELDKVKASRSIPPTEQEDVNSDMIPFHDEDILQFDEGSEDTSRSQQGSGSIRLRKSSSKANKSYVSEEYVSSKSTTKHHHPSAALNNSKRQPSSASFDASSSNSFPISSQSQSETSPQIHPEFSSKVSVTGADSRSATDSTQLSASMSTSNDLKLVSSFDLSRSNSLKNSSQPPAGISSQTSNLELSSEVSLRNSKGMDRPHSSSSKDASSSIESHALSSQQSKDQPASLSPNQTPSTPASAIPKYLRKKKHSKKVKAEDDYSESNYWNEESSDEDYLHDELTYEYSLSHPPSRGQQSDEETNEDYSKASIDPTLSSRRTTDNMMAHSSTPPRRHSRSNSKSISKASPSYSRSVTHQQLQSSEQEDQSNPTNVPHVVMHLLDGTPKFETLLPPTSKPSKSGHRTMNSTDYSLHGPNFDPLTLPRRVQPRPIDIGSSTPDSTILIQDGSRPIHSRVLSEALFAANVVLPPSHRIHERNLSISLGASGSLLQIKPQ